MYVFGTVYKDLKNVSDYKFNETLAILYYHFILPYMNKVQLHKRGIDNDINQQNLHIYSVDYHFKELLGIN